MKCPACGQPLVERVVDGVSFDVCAQGCAGIWFDWHELARVDEPDEAAGDVLLDVVPDPHRAVDVSQHRNCPRCGGTVLMRHFHSVRRAVEMDECAQCGGMWLDVGELRTIRSQYASEDERREAARAYFSDVFDGDLAAASRPTQEQLERARRFAHTMRFLCPSSYLPGDQEWGAF